MSKDNSSIMHFGSSTHNLTRDGWGRATKSPVWVSIGGGVLECNTATGPVRIRRDENNKWVSVNNDHLKQLLNAPAPTMSDTVAV